MSIRNYYKNIRKEHMATRKDYIGIAQAIRQTKRECNWSARSMMEKTVEPTLIKFFAKDNPRFNEKLFKEACSL